MPVLVLLALALTSGAAAGFVAWRYPRIARQSATPALDVARKAGETVGRHPSLCAVLDARLDPAVATGLAPTVALLLAIGGGLLLGLLAYLVRANSLLVGIDNSVAKWDLTQKRRSGIPHQKRRTVQVWSDDLDRFDAFEVQAPRAAHTR